MILLFDGWGIIREIALRWISMDLIDNKSIQFPILVWCKQAMNQSWPSSITPYGVTRPQRVDILLRNKWWKLLIIRIFITVKLWDPWTSCLPILLIEHMALRVLACCHIHYCGWDAPRLYNTSLRAIMWPTSCYEPMRPSWAVCLPNEVVRKDHQGRSSCSYLGKSGPFLNIKIVFPGKEFPCLR